jgi:modification methylase
MTVRPWWRDGQLVDLPGALATVGEPAGLVLYERNVALLTALRVDTPVPRSSFFALEQVRKGRAAGVHRSIP